MMDGDLCIFSIEHHWKFSTMNLTFQIKRGEVFWIGKIKEYPAVLTQGKNPQEVKQNLKDALEMYLRSIKNAQ